MATATSPSPTAIRRLTRDLQKLQAEPIDGITALPLDENILEWHYCIRGTVGSPYEGGLYHGKLVFKPDFPWTPPAIYMFTPNGRFQPNTRLCLSISDYHPESWNPGWTVSAILVGLHSFMNENSFATGCEQTSEARKRELATKSRAFNLRNATFCKQFPTIVAECQADGVIAATDEEMAASTSSRQPHGARGNVNLMAMVERRVAERRGRPVAAGGEAPRGARQVRARAGARNDVPMLPDDIIYGGNNVAALGAVDGLANDVHQPQPQANGRPMAPENDIDQIINEEVRLEVLNELLMEDIVGDRRPRGPGEHRAAPPAVAAAPPLVDLVGDAAGPANPRVRVADAADDMEQPAIKRSTPEVVTLDD